MPDSSKIPKVDDERAARIRQQQGPLDNETSAVLTRVYLARRLEYQLEYYKSKEREFLQSSDKAFRAGAIIMTITSLLAALGVSGDAPPVLRVLTAILPASAALVASFRSLYQWDRQAQLFKDTALGLERAKLVLPDMDQVDTNTAAKVFPRLVETTELVFEDEVNQWGQIAIGEEEGDTESDANIAKFAKDYGLDVFDTEGNLDQAKLGAFKDILAASQSSQGPALSIEYPAMDAGAAEGPGAPEASSTSRPQFGQDEDQEAEIEDDEADAANDLKTGDNEADDPPKENP